MPSRPPDTEFAPHFKKYVDLVSEADILAVLEGQIGVLHHLAGVVSAEQETFAYGPGKWTTRQVVGHLTDAERVFGFRVFAFSRFDPNPLPGFDDEGYVEQSHSADVPISELVEDLVVARRANLRVLRPVRPLSEDQWLATGTANGKPITVRAIAFVMAGHIRHHLQLLHERYGIGI